MTKTFQLEEATIGDVHDAYKSGALTAKDLGYGLSRTPRQNR